MLHGPFVFNPSPHSALVLIPNHTTALAHLQRVTFTALDGAGFQRSAYGTHGVPRIGRAGHIAIITPLMYLTAVTRQANDSFLLSLRGIFLRTTHTMVSPRSADATNLATNLANEAGMPTPPPRIGLDHGGSGSGGRGAGTAASLGRV